jgi:hypothetical protein
MPADMLNVAGLAAMLLLTLLSIGHGGLGGQLLPGTLATRRPEHILTPTFGCEI